MKAKRIIFAVVLVNAAGIALRYFNFDTYFILLGFRFHISCIIPFLFLFREGFPGEVKNYLKFPKDKKYVSAILKVILPVIFLSGLLFYFKIIKLGNPEYFYEFGMSSIIDYPLYLIWNFPQLVMLFLFLNISSSGKVNKILFISFILILLFLFEFIPLEKHYTIHAGYISFAFVVFIVAVLQKLYLNIYLFPVMLFTILWSVLLLFGSSSHELINILFAARYSGWEGFFEISKNYELIIIPGYLVIILICLLFKKDSKK